MLYHISEELGLDTYVDETKELFLALLEFVPRPKSVSDLKSYNNTWGISSDVSDQLQASQFPGFSKICASIETCLRKRFDEMMVDEECARELQYICWHTLHTLYLMCVSTIFNCTFIFRIFASS